MPTRKPSRWLVGNRPGIRGCMTKGAGGAELEIGHLVLVRKTSWKGKHKMQDRWDSDEYQVIGQPTPGIPVYKVKCVAGAGLGFYIESYCSPCKVRSDNKVGWRWRTSKNHDEEKDEDDGMLGVTREPQIRKRRGIPPLSQVPLSMLRHLGKMPLLT